MTGAAPEKRSVRTARLAAALLALAGCASTPRARALADPKPLPARPGIVFLIHGIWPDGLWVPEAERGFREAGIETVPVDYTTFVLGYLFGFGTDEAADRVAGFVRALEVRHAATRCAAPLRYHALAFSGGTIVTLKSAWRGVRFETAHLGGCPVACFSPVLADAVREERIGAITNYWSLFDGITGWGLGASQFGYHGFDEDEGLAIRNVPLAYYHLAPPFDAEFAAGIARELNGAAAAAKSPPHTCFADPAFAIWWRRQTDRLAEGEAVEPDPAAPGATVAASH